ncbi:hypothetical protein [Micromonospora chokoriensis]|uniref:hypothetical protein n=1 Tax=Micromonospora chokoriensis TaxID=356851 RepID=UPI0004C2F8F2|nr:hypothetical protein [Micromonospora chokoriensis]
MPPTIRHDEPRLEAARKKVDLLRSQINSVRSGFNPADSGHPHGLPFESLNVAAGGDAFPSGANLKARLKQVGSSVDKVLVGHETQLSSLSRALTVNLRLGEDAELRNVNTASNVGLPNTTTTNNTTTNPNSTTTNPNSTTTNNNKSS